MKPTIYVGRPPEREIGVLEYILAAGLTFLVVAAAAGCNAPLDPERFPPPVADAAAVLDASPGFSFRYCNTDLPQNQTKFLAADVLPGTDGGGCAVDYEISFGAVTFGCTCGDEACDAAYAALAAQADVCLAREADAGQ